MKKMLFAALCIWSVSCFGQIEEKATISKPFIEVTGTAIKEVIPDEIFISIILSDKVVNNDDYLIEAKEDSLKVILTGQIST